MNRRVNLGREFNKLSENDLIVCSLKDHLGVVREGAWSVSLRLT